MAILTVFAVVANGEPVTGDNAAVELLTLNTEIVDEEVFATSKNFFAGSVAIESGDEPPVATGEPVTRCRAPDVGSIW